jgi:hypothetical protein
MPPYKFQLNGTTSLGFPLHLASLPCKRISAKIGYKSNEIFRIFLDSLSGKNFFYIQQTVSSGDVEVSLSGNSATGDLTTLMDCIGEYAAKGRVVIRVYDLRCERDEPIPYLDWFLAQFDEMVPVEYQAEAQDFLRSKFGEMSGKRS